MVSTLGYELTLDRLSTVSVSTPHAVAHTNGDISYFCPHPPQERFNVTESVFHDRLVKDDLRQRSARWTDKSTPKSPTSGLGWGQTASSQLDRRKRYLSWGDEDPDRLSGHGKNF